MMKKLEALRVNVGRNLPLMGPWPVRDTFGMMTAVATLMRTLDPGKTEATIQYDTARRFRSFSYNLWHSSVEGTGLAVISGDQDRSQMMITDNPTSKGWYTRFSLGMHKRMGDNPKPDLAISIEVMHAMMNRFDLRWQTARLRGQDAEESDALFGALFCVVAFCGALRGEEEPLMDLRKCIELHPKGMAEGGNWRHTVIPLVGRFKNKVGKQCHLIPLAAVTASGLQPGRWVEQMIHFYQ